MNHPTDDQAAAAEQLRIFRSAASLLASSLELESRRHHLEVHMPPESAYAWADRKRVVQILVNLLNNAAKYTPEGGHIVLALHVLDERVELSVTDDGIGMAPELLERAFELFTQAERSADRSQGGLGIGLTLVKSLVELHGGRVHAHSGGLGKGSRFVVCLPRLIRQAEQHAAPLERVRREPPDVCLLDIGLPDMDGHELVKRLRAQPESAQALMIAITGYGQEQDRKLAIGSGFDHHFVKPVDTDKLAQLLREVSLAERHAFPAS